MDRDERFVRMLDDVMHVRLLVERNTVTLERNTEDLREHIRRTAAAETRLEALEDAHTQFKGFVRLSARGAAIVAAVVGAIKALSTVFSGLHL